MDGENVQGTSSGETQTQATEPQNPAAGTVPEKPFTRVDAEAMMSTLVERAIKAERLSRQFQSDKDKAVAEVHRLEVERQALLQGTQDLDEDTRNKLELTRLRAGQTYQQQIEALLRQQEEERKLVDEFYQVTRESLSEMGMNPDDKRLDWGDKEKESLSEKHKRILGQAAKIHKESTAKKEAAFSQQLKDMEAKIRKDLGLDTVDTSTGTAVNGIPTSAEALRRYVAGLSSEEYDKVAPQIKEMRRKGLIK